MSKKPDGQGTHKQKKVSVFKTYVTKPNRHARRQLMVKKQSETVGGKRMRVACGTERARRRYGLHQGWRTTGAGPKMQPSANPLPMFEATHSVTLSEATLKDVAKQKAMAVRRISKLV